MKNGKALHKIIGWGIAVMAVLVFAGTSYSRTPCNTCQTCPEPAPPVVKEYAELEYRDGYPGSRRYKRQQVKKLQCMLTALGYCSGSYDGWYGNSTARAVMLYLADTFQEIGYGKKVTKEQWEHLVSQAGHRCTKFDKKRETYRYQYTVPEHQTHQFYQYKY